MVRVTSARPIIVIPVPGWASKHWLLLPTLVVAAGVGAGTALGPLKALVALALVVVVACIWMWPALGAYLLIGLTPLIVGISRGVALPLLRPNEALALLVGFALMTRGVAQLRTGELPKLCLLYTSPSP